MNKGTENIEDRVNNSLDKIRPFLQIDQGDVEFVSFDVDAGILYLKLTGNCADCPFSIMTLRAGIERFLKTEISEIYRVEQVKS